MWERWYLGSSAQLDPSGLGQGDLYLLTHHDGVPFVHDGTRDGEHVRTTLTMDFTQALVEQGKPWLMLTGSLEERLHLAERVVADIVRRRFTFNRPI